MSAMDSASGDLPELNRLRKALRRELPYLQQRFSVCALGIFGSFVRGEQTNASDLDVLVEFDETPSLLTFIALENYLSDQLGVKVDLVMRDALKPRIGEQILREVVPL